MKIQFLDPKRAKLYQNSSFSHVRTYSWLHKLRNTQGKINGTHLGNRHGISEEYISRIHKYWWYKIIRNTDPMGRRRRRRLCVWDYFIFYIINIYGYISYTFLIYSIYAYMFPRYVPCIFPCVFLKLWSQEKTSPYRKTSFIFFIDFIPFIYLFIIFITVDSIN